MSTESAGQGPALSEGLGHADPERAWLVEWKAHGYGPQWWGFKYTPGKHGDWCHDANDAIRFSRKVDAERMRLHVIAAAGLTGRHDYEGAISVTEHEWPNVRANPAAEGGPARSAKVERGVMRVVPKREGL